MMSYHILFLYDVLNWDLLKRPSYQKMSQFNIFQYEISYRMSFRWILYDNFQNPRKMTFQWERGFQPILNLKTVLNLQNIENPLRPARLKLFFKKQHTTQCQYENLMKLINYLFHLLKLTVCQIPWQIPQTLDMA